MVSYSPSLFVGRKAEIERVMSKARALAAGKAILRPAERVIHFPGFVGSGKTWLLHHLHHLMTADDEQKIPQAIVLHLRLNQDWKQRHSCISPYEEITCLLLRHLLRQIHQACGIKSALDDVETSQLTLHETSQWVRDAVQEVQNRRIVVLLADELDEIPPEWLRVLEAHLFAPLLQPFHTLLVLAGRNLHHNWVNLALKPPPDDQAIRLEPLDKQDTCHQLELQFPGTEILSDSIYALTGGVPGGNSLIASQAGRPPHMPDETHALVQHNGQIMRDVPKDLHWCFYALCVARGFQTESMEYLLPIADPDGRHWDSSACQGLIPRLTHTRLVRFYRRDGESRYWLDEYLRPLLELELQKRDPDLWRKLHCALIRMYQIWVANPRFADTAPRWQEEIDYHSRRLKAADYDPAGCPQN